MDREEIPHHFEAIPLARPVRLLGWPAGILGFVGGVTAMVALAGSWAELAGAAVASLGSLTVFGLIRFRRYEIVVGSRWVEAGTGPLRHSLGREGLVVGPAQPATSWRRLYTDREVPITSYGRTVRVPTRDPDGLLESCSG